MQIVLLCFVLLKSQHPFYTLCHHTEVFPCYWPVSSRFLHKGPVVFYTVFDVNLKKQLNKQLICWWFEKAWCSCDVTVMVHPCVTFTQVHQGYITATRAIIYLWVFQVNDSRWPGSWFNMKVSSHHYRKSYCGNETAIRLSYFHNGISYADEMSSLYRIRALGWCTVCFVTLNSSQIKSKSLTLIWGNLCTTKSTPGMAPPGVRESSGMKLTYFLFHNTLYPKCKYIIL